MLEEDTSPDQKGSFESEPTARSPIDLCGLMFRILARSTGIRWRGPTALFPCDPEWLLQYKSVRPKDNRSREAT